MDAIWGLIGSGSRSVQPFLFPLQYLIDVR